jgi:hypothetical protein
MSCYQITKEFRIHHEDGWFYKFTDDGEGCIEVEYYEVIGGTEFAKFAETKQGSSFSIPKNCIETFIRVLGQME